MFPNFSIVRNIKCMHTETHIDTHITIRSNVSNEETKKQTKLIERKQQNTYIKQRPLNEG